METEGALSTIRDTLTTRRVFGDPIVIGDTTIVPVAKVRGGGGQAAVGAGFGVQAAPVGVFAIHDGHVQWKPALNVNRIILGGQIVAMTAIVTLAPALLAWILRRK